MPVSELLRGLGGALTGLLAALILLLSLAETRERFGRTEHGIAWVARKTNSERFESIWMPLVFFGLPTTVLGYATGVRLTTRRRVQYAMAGALLGLAFAWLIPSRLPEKYGRAGENTILMLGLVAAFIGALVGAMIAERRKGGQRFED